MGRGADAAGGDPVAAAVAAEKAAAEAATSTPSPPSSSSRDWHFLPYPVGHRKRASFVRHYETLLAARADAAARHAYVPSVRAALDGDGFASLRRLNVLTFDPAAHPVLRAFRALIGVADDADLSRAHLSFRDFSRRSSHLDDKASLLAPLARDSPARDAFVDAYDALVLAVVAPAVAAAMGPELEDAILYAAFPCVRVQQPCEFHTIRAHVDSMYNHPEGSVNCWLPLTSAFGANTLQLESAPGAEDFRPLVLDHGAVAMFHGHSVAHFTVANTTDETRVSLDFRVVPRSVHDPSAECTARKGPGDASARQCYNVSGYYSAARRGDDGIWRKVVSGRPSARHGFPHRNDEMA